MSSSSGGNAHSNRDNNTNPLPGQLPQRQPSKPSSKTKTEMPNGQRNVHWTDMHGFELTQVREFEPSVPSDDEEAEEYAYEKKSCCVIS